MVPVPQIKEKIAEVITNQGKSRWRSSLRTTEHVAIAVPQIQEEIEEVVPPLPQEGTRERCVQQTCVSPVPQIVEDIVQGSVLPMPLTPCRRCNCGRRPCS